MIHLSSYPKSFLEGKTASIANIANSAMLSSSKQTQVGTKNIKLTKTPFAFTCTSFVRKNTFDFPTAKNGRHLKWCLTTNIKHRR